jgi:hypothetical protein
MSALIPALVLLCILLSVVFAGAALVSWARRKGQPEVDADASIVSPRANTLPASETPRSAEELPYIRQRYLLTQAEREFFAVLRHAAPPGWYVFPQVRLANLVQLKKGTRNWKPHFSRVAQKCVDFVLCDGVDIEPRLVVELDDASHNRPDRQNRDAFVDAALRAAGLPILHVRWQRQYDALALTAQIQAAAQVSSSSWPSYPPAFAIAQTTSGGTASRGGFHNASQARTSMPKQRWACRSCNAEVSATAKFCKDCGATLEL